VDFSSIVYRLASPGGFLEVRLNLLFSVSVDSGIIRASKSGVKQNANRSIYSSGKRCTDI
jgi:hypothetical protein